MIMEIASATISLDVFDSAVPGDSKNLGGEEENQIHHVKLFNILVARKRI